MNKSETRNKIKFHRKLTNKINRSLALISNNSVLSCDSLSDNFNDSHNINNIRKIADDNITIDSANNDINVNIPYNNELSTNNVDESSNNIEHNHNNNSNNAQNNVSLTSKLAAWAINENITLASLGKLLPIIREIPGSNDIPKDPRTLVKTPRKINVKSIGCGTYFYFGIEKTLNSFCINHKISIQQNEEFLLAINIDGLPLSKSSNSSFWPILCSVKSIKILINQVFLVALYHGSAKPKSDDFLKDFINESIHLSTNGILINSVTYKFRILMLICDSPAKSFV